MNKHNLNWFNDRVGQRIYPSYDSFERGARPILTEKYAREGILVKDGDMAVFLFESQEKSGTRYSAEREVLA